MIAQPRAVLSNCSLFAGLDGADIAAIERQVRSVSFDAGQLVFSRGDPATDLFIVAEGRIRISILSGDGRELSFAHVTAGEVFGEVAVLDGEGRTADATAITKVVAFSLSKTALDGLMGANPRIARAIVTFLCRRLRQADLQIEMIALHSVEVRLARFLLAAVRISGAVPGKGGVPLNLSISQSEIGLLIGASRPKVNAGFSSLIATGAIKKSGAAVICDVAQLEEICEAGN